MAAITTRSHYRVEILCPTSKSELRLERGSAQERLGILFEVNLSLYSEDREIDMLALLGQSLAVHVTSDNDERYFHGIVSHFSLVGFSDRYAHYQAVLRPKLWLLGQSASCKVFRSMTVSDILQKTFQAGGVDFDEVSSPQVQFEHCVQYRETDLYFVSRLMERYGVYYFHKHEKDKHQLHVVKDQSGHSEVGTFTHTDAGSVGDEYQISEWRLTTALRSSSYRVAGTKNLTRQPIDAKHKTRFAIDAAPPLKIDEFEAVDEYAKPYLEELAKVRMQAIDATVEEFTGRSSSLKLEVGGLFTLEGHRRADQNRKYLIVAATYQFEGDLPDGGPAAEDPYRVFFQAIDSKTPFSPPVLTKKPVVQGPHLATVTEETDEYGRVLVQFHWGNTNGDIESCRARVSQNWAGKEWGGVFLPHKGHEVIVEFLDGDPDQPLVTGRVYNKESMPPLSLPGNKQKSIIRDHGGNEIMMDGADPTSVRIFSPKHNSEVLLGGDTWSHKHSGDGDLLVKFKGKKTELIDKDKTVIVKGGVTRLTEKEHDEHVLKDYTLTVDGHYKLITQKDWHENIFGCQSKHIHGWKNEGIMGAETKHIHGAKIEHVVGGKLSTGASYDFTKFVKKKDTIKDDYQVEAGKAISFKTEDFTQNLKNLFIECTEKADITYKDATIDGDSHTHKPTNEFVVSTKHIQLTGDDKVEISSSVLDLLGVLEVKK